MKTTAAVVDELMQLGHEPNVISCGGPPTPGDSGHAVYGCSCGREYRRPFGEPGSWDTFLRFHLREINHQRNVDRAKQQGHGSTTHR